MIGSMFSLLMDNLPVFDMFITPLLSGVSAFFSPLRGGTRLT
jgi:hypothetical protein